MSPSSISSAPTASPVGGDPLSGNPLSRPPVDQGEVPLWRCAVLLVIGAVAGMAYWFNPATNLEPRAGVVMELPVLMGDYFGKKGEMSQAEMNILPKDTELVRRIYADSQGHEITCSIVLSGAEQRSIHRPEACLTGQGWDITGQDYISIPLASGHNLTARRLTLEREAVGANNEHFPVRAFYIYWFVGQGVTTSSHVKRILLSNWDRVVHGRAHRWAYVSFFSMVTDNLRPGGADEKQTQSLLVDFSRQIVPSFQISEMPSQAKN